MYKLNPVSRRIARKRPGFNPRTYKVKTRFQNLLSTCTATKFAFDSYRYIFNLYRFIFSLYDILSETV
jgi:hypothetical protein